MLDDLIYFGIFLLAFCIVAVVAEALAKFFEWE